MTHHTAIARSYHERLPEELWDLLEYTGITPAVVHGACIGWDGRALTIPVYSPGGQFRYFEYWWITPDGDLDRAPIQANRRALVGWDALRGTPESVVVVDGLIEHLVFKSQGIPAMAISGSSLALDPEWQEAFSQVERQYLCFKNTDDSRTRLQQLASQLSDPVIILLPEEAQNWSGYFVDCGFHAKDFQTLLQEHLEDHLSHQ